MCSEELFDINQKISQIRCTLQKRKQKVAQWSMPYTKILEQKPNKNFYLSKLSQTHQKLGRYQQCSQEKKKLAESLVQQSRRKIYGYRNELKQLDELLKKRNKIRIKTIDQNKQNNENKQKQNRRQKNFEQKFITNNEWANNLFLSRSKQRTNPFQALKVEKLIQFYQNIKNQANNEVRFPGIGLDNTNFYSISKKQPKKQEKKTKTQKIKSNKVNISKQFNQQYEQKKNTLGYIPRTNLFDDRMKKIIKYHGMFWQKEIKLLEQ